MDVAQKFQQFETKHDLSEFIVDGFWYYPIVKMLIYFDLAGKNSRLGSESRKKIPFLTSIVRQFLRGIRWKFKSAKLRPVKYLFVDYALTRRQNDSGRFENMYIGPIMNIFGREEQLLFEYPALDFGHYAHIEEEKIYFPDWDIFRIFLKARIKKRKWITDGTHLKALYELFDLTFDAGLIDDRLNKTFLFIKFFKRFLERVQPQIILLIDGYDYKQMALIYAAKVLRIPTVELQHGLINASHMAYMYKQVINRRLFADYLFTFGEYFSNLIKDNSIVWDSYHVISVGFPYIEAVKARPIELPDRLKVLSRRFKIIYVTSQWTVRTELKDFIVQLSERLSDAYMIFYKIHPGEKDTQKFYEAFRAHENIELILDKSVNSMEIMKVAAVHSTVYSTSYFESVFFELPNIFIEVPKYSESIGNFVDNKTTFIAKSVNDYLHYLDRIEGDSSLALKLYEKRTTFYKPNALANIVAALDDVLTSIKT